MASRRRIVEVLALLALALVVPAAVAAPAARAPIVIANYADDGSPGTLRHAIASVALPGDTIRFAGSVRLELRTPLVVPQRLSGLTIDGATPAGGRATLFGARFQSSSATLPLAFARAHGIEPSRSVLVGNGPAHKTLATTLGARYVPITQ